MAKLYKLKVLIFLVLGISTLSIIGLGFYVSSLNDIIQEGLQTKKFLQPTSFYSKPVTFSSTNHQSFKDINQVFVERNYRLRSPDQTLLNGDYRVLEPEACKALHPDQPEVSGQCIQYKTMETLDPEFENIGVQTLAFDDQQKLTLTSPSPEARLEPEVFLRLIDTEPIEQTYKELGEFPPSCLKAVLAIEDSKFLEHSGVSWTGLARAALNNLLGGPRQGGSTITQQLVKNYFLNSELTLKRKFKEFWMSLLLEQSSSKDQIFETYLNIIYLGQNGALQIRGYGSASQFYFKKDLSTLNLSECALLGAILNSPGLFNPFTKPENSKKRRELVLNRMKDLDFISEEERALASSAPLPTSRSDSIIDTAPYYLNVVRRELTDRNLIVPGSSVFTGLNPMAQRAAQKAVQGQLERLSTDNKRIQSLKESGHQLEGTALLASNLDGLIQAIVGGRNFRLTQFNRAIEARRQVGSLFKPLIYLAALESNSEFSPTTLLSDEKFTVRFEGQNWTPENYSKKYSGSVPAFYALKTSLNSANAKLGLDTGLENIIELAQKMGAHSEMKAWPSLTLGAFEMRMIEVLEIYVTLGRGGSHVPLSSLRSVVSNKGEVLWARELQPIQVVNPASAAVLTGMLRQVPLTGTAQSLSKSGFKWISAGKTGTTSDSKDAWYAGYTQDWTAITWVGFDDNTSHKLTGGSGAVPIWNSLMSSVLKNQEPQDFIWPDSVEEKTVDFTDPESGLTSNYNLIFRKN